MDLPSSRELELEAALRRRDAQVAELTDEVTQLRQYLSTQPGPSTTDPVTLPPALVALLLPHINATSPSGNAVSSSSTVTTALTQRAKLLQEENDELYELLKAGETGRLKEEVRGLRRAVGRLESALRESHQVIRTLSEELDKSYDVVQSAGRQHNHAASHSYGPRQAHQPSPNPQSNGNGLAKPVPTGPRAHKKPRLSEPQNSPSNSSSALPRIQTQSTSSSTRQADSPERSPLLSPDHRKASGAKMETDDDQRARPRSPAPRDRERGRERPRDRDRDRERTSRRYGGHGHGRRSRGSGAGGGSGKGGGGGGGDGGGYGGDRTLAERMGLGHLS